MRFLTLLFVSLLAPALAFAGPIKDGQKAYDAGRAEFYAEHKPDAGRELFLKAYALWKPLAEQGDAVAQYMIGVMYQHGEGVGKDPVEAAKWYFKSAEQGHPTSQGLIDSFLNQADKTKELLTEYFSGPDTAQYELSEMYEKGEGVKQDLVQAYMWRILVMSRYHDATYAISELSGKMSSEQIEEAKRLALEWKPAPIKIEKIYGTDRNSKAQREQCMRDTGKNCIFDFCEEQWDILHPVQFCKNGWKSVNTPPLDPNN